MRHLLWQPPIIRDKLSLQATFVAAIKKNVSVIKASTQSVWLGNRSKANASINNGDYSSGFPAAAANDGNKT